MGSRLDDGVFIRSLAALSDRGALAEHLPLLIRLLEAFGFGLIFLETVGAGQGDTAVRSFVDVVVLLLQPESGDDLQWEKAGVLEVADIIVVHKADLPGADQTIAQVRAALDYSSQKQVPVVKVSSRTGEGLDVLWRRILECPRRRGEVDPRAELLRLAQETLTAQFWKAVGAKDPQVQKLLLECRNGTLAADAGTALLRSLTKEKAPGGTRSLDC